MTLLFGSFVFLKKIEKSFIVGFRQLTFCLEYMCKCMDWVFHVKYALGEFDQRQYIEFVRHGEYDMKVAGGEKLAFASCEPLLARLHLAFRTMPVAGRVIRDGPVTALRTGIDVAAQRSRAATLNGSESLVMESVGKRRFSTRPKKTRIAAT